MKGETTMKTHSRRVEMAVNESNDKFEQVHKQKSSDLVHSHTCRLFLCSILRKEQKNILKFVFNVVGISSLPLIKCYKSMVC